MREKLIHMIILIFFCFLILNMNSFSCAQLIQMQLLYPHPYWFFPNNNFNQNYFFNYLYQFYKNRYLPSCLGCYPAFWHYPYFPQFWHHLNIIGCPFYNVYNADFDGDGVPNNLDLCPNNSRKIVPGICGCNGADIDSDSDGILDCKDNCSNDPENDIDADEICGDIDNCPYISNPGQEDTYEDGPGDACDPNIIVRNPKIIHPQSILKDFIDGKTKTKVIVNLARPEHIQVAAFIKDLTLRKDLANEISRIQNIVIGRIDSINMRITNRFKYIFGYAAEVTLEGLRQLTEINEVVSIEKDFFNQLHLAQGLSLIKATSARKTYNGSGLAIAICDTGIDYNHPKLGNGGFPNSKVIGGYDTGDNDSDPMDEVGHGTCGAGIAAGDLGHTGDYIGGVAYNARLYALKVSTGAEGGAWDSDILEALQWCIDHQNDDPDNPIMIISMSYGWGRFYDRTSCENSSPAYTMTTAHVQAVGITFFVSSGNEGFCNSTQRPACLRNVISVGAVYDADIGRYPPIGYVGCISNGSCIGYECSSCPEKCYEDLTTAADQVTLYSNSASFLNLLAPSHNAYTTDILGSDGYDNGDYYSSFGGTSAACPYAAGVAACLQNAANVLNHAFLTPEEIELILMVTGDLVTDPKSNITTPRINLEAALNYSPCDLSWLYLLLLT